MTETTTITIVIDTEIDLELERQAQASGHSKPDIARDVLADWLQDQADARDAAILLARNEPSATSAEVRRRLPGPVAASQRRRDVSTPLRSARHDVKA